MQGIAFGSYFLDPKARQLFRRGVSVHLEPKVMDLLLCLTQHRDRCVSPDELRAKLWPDVLVGEASLRRLVKELRKTIADDCVRTPHLRTVHGRGYQFLGQTGDARTQEPEPLSALAQSEPLLSTEAVALFVGPGLAKAVASIEHVVAFGLPVILEGETGTGKDCVARAIHAWSRRPGDLVTVRRAGLSETALDAALSQARAPSATLVLDELGEWPLLLQSRLIDRLSDEDLSNRDRLARRVVVTSRHSLLGLVGRGELRGDLLVQLNGITVELPPLRDRCEDVAGLVDFFLARSGGEEAAAVPPAVMAALTAYDWPFNSPKSTNRHAEMPQTAIRHGRTGRARARVVCEHRAFRSSAPVTKSRNPNRHAPSTDTPFQPSPRCHHCDNCYTKQSCVIRKPCGHPE